MNISDLLTNNDIADNQFSAGHIATGLKLWECETDEEKLKRARLYRKWRPSTEKKKNKLIPTYQAYDLTIAGIDPDDVEIRQVEMSIDELT